MRFLKMLKRGELGPVRDRRELRGSGQGQVGAEWAVCGCVSSRDGDWCGLCVGRRVPAASTTSEDGG